MAMAMGYGSSQIAADIIMVSEIFEWRWMEAKLVDEVNNHKIPT